MKRKIILLSCIIASLLLIFAFGITASAEETTEATSAPTIVASGSCGDNVTYTLDSDGLLTINGTGDMYNYSSYYESHSPWSGESYENIVISDGVTSIGDYAFADSSYLTSITIPDSVTSIGYRAFYGCTGLTSITIPDSVTNIGHDAFRNCTGLTSITIPDSVISIGDRAFDLCYRLTVTKAPFDIVKRGVFASSQCKSVSLNSIGQWCSYDFTDDSYFDNVENLYLNGELVTNVLISDDYDKITADTFKNIRCIEKFEIDKNSTVYKLGINGELRLIDGTLIAYPNAIKSLRIENGFELDSLQYMTNLESVSIAADVEEIPEGAFKNCVALKEITVDEGNENYCAVDNVLYSKTMRRLYVYPACKPGTEFTVPSKVVRFLPYAFANNKHLEKFTIPDTVTIVDEHLFYNSTGLKEITLNSNIKTIGDYAFSGCSVLKKINYNANQITSLSSTIFENSGNGGHGITVIFGDNISTVPSNIFYDNSANVKDVYIGSNATSIGSYAFYNCTSVKNVHVGEKVTSFGSYAFYNCNDIEKVYITDIEKWLSSSFSNNTSNPLRYAKELYVNNEKYDTLKLDKTGSVSINSYAFYGFSGLSSVDIKGSSVYINDYAFTGSGLKNLTLTSDNGITVRDSFENCTSLGKVSLKAGTSINIYTSAFSGCVSTKTVSLTADDTISVGSSAFSGCIAINTVSLTADDTITVGSYAFSGCTSLASVNISDASGTIGSSAFNGCSALNSLRIGNGITSIGSSAFKGCSSLESVIVPVSVTTINGEAFADCKKLKNIYILNADCIAADSAENTVYKNAVIHSHEGGNVQAYADLFGFDFNPIHIGVGEYFTSAKCTEPGEKYQKCKYCDVWANTSSVPALGHEFSTEKADDEYLKSAADCEHKAVYYKSCVRCGLSSKGTENESTFESGEALGHNWNDWTSDNAGKHTRTCQTDSTHTETANCSCENPVSHAATCTENAYDVYTCDTCGYSWTVVTENSALGHTPGEAVRENEIPATCTSAGSYDSVVYCSVCNAELSRTAKVIEKIDHTSGEAVKENVVSATCTTAGRYDSVVYCTACKTEISRTAETIAALGHDIVKHEAKAPTCTEIGWDAYDTCSRCDYTTHVEKAALGHNLVNHEAKAPTCTEIGWDAYDTCSRCDYTTYVEKAVLGHKAVTDAAVAATCTKTGLTEGSHCSVCNTVIKKQETVPALGHKAVTDKAVAATCIKTGLTEGAHCSVCNTVIKKQETVPALGHDFTGTARTNADGSISYKCTRCDEYGATVKPAEKKLDEITGTKRLTQDNVDVLVAPVEMTASTVLASANGAKLVDENGKEVTNGEKPLATGMKVILGKTSVTISVAGDVDGTGDISVSDARLALRAAVKLDTLTGADFTSADVDFSGDISVSDARLILRAAVKLDDPKKAWIK